MEIKLSQNIRRNRKERKLTQEQLAEVLGVTTGAVYKWEAGLSLPELAMLMELADFFDTSVDTLLGYEMKDNGLSSTLARLQGAVSEKDASKLVEAEKALKRYPNNFEIVHSAALLFYIAGNDNKDKGMLMRSLELYQKAQKLISQNRHPKWNETTLSGSIALVYDALGEKEKAAGIMKENNTGGIYDTVIGSMLAQCGILDEAEEFLSQGFLSSVSTIVNFIYGQTLLSIRRKEYGKANDVVEWGTQFLCALRAANAPGYLDRLLSTLYFLLGYAKLRLGDRTEAAEHLKKAADTAERFDSKPCYSSASIRFVCAHVDSKLYDVLGRTAAESLDTCRREINDSELDTLWKEVTDNGE